VVSETKYPKNNCSCKERPPNFSPNIPRRRESLLKSEFGKIPAETGLYPVPKRLDLPNKGLIANPYLFLQTGFLIRSYFMNLIPAPRSLGEVGNF
jgi:hypothetical protein